jgi:hypothetical protein
MTDKKKITPILLDEETRRRLEYLSNAEDMWFSEYVSYLIDLQWEIVKGPCAK